MTTDQFIEFLSMLCTKLLPILGCLLFIFIIILIRKMIEFFKTLNVTLKSVNTAVETTNEQIRKLDAPLNTVSELSQTVDNFHRMSQNAAKSALLTILSNLSAIRDWILGQLGKEEAFEEFDSEAVCPESKDTTDSCINKVD